MTINKPLLEAFSISNYRKRLLATLEQIKNYSIKEILSYFTDTIDINKITQILPTKIINEVEKNGLNKNFAYFILELIYASLKNNNLRGLKFSWFLFINLKKIKEITKDVDPLYLLYIVITSYEMEEVEKLPSITEIVKEIIEMLNDSDSWFINNNYLILDYMKTEYDTYITFKKNKYKLIKETDRFKYYELKTVKDCQTLARNTKLCISSTEEPSHAQDYLETSLTDSIVIAIEKTNKESVKESSKYAITLFKLNSALKRQVYYEIRDERNEKVDSTLEKIFIKDLTEYFLKHGQKNIDNQYESIISDIDYKIENNKNYFNLYSEIDILTMFVYPTFSILNSVEHFPETQVIVYPIYKTLITNSEKIQKRISKLKELYNSGDLIKLKLGVGTGQEKTRVFIDYLMFLIIIWHEENTESPFYSFIIDNVKPVINDYKNIKEIICNPKIKSIEIIKEKPKMKYAYENYNFQSLEETYSRKSFIENLGKGFLAKYELVKDKYPTIEDFVKELETYDLTPEKTLMVPFSIWIKNINVDDEDMLDTFLLTLKEYSEYFADAYKRNIPFLRQSFYNFNPYKITAFSEFVEYFEKIKDEVEKQKEKIKRKSELSKKIEKARIHVDEPLHYFKSDSQEMNCILGKGTKWCVSSKEPDKNETRMYNDLNIFNFYYIFDMSKKKEIEKTGQTVVEKYAYLIHSIYASVMANGFFFFDFRDDEDKIMKLNNETARKIFDWCNENIGKKELSEQIDFFFKTQVKSGEFPPITVPPAAANIHIPAGVYDMSSFYMFIGFSNLPFYAHGGGQKNKHIDTITTELSGNLPYHMQQMLPDYKKWDHIFYRDVFVEVWKKFDRIIESMFDNNTYVLKNSIDTHKGESAIVGYISGINLLKNYGDQTRLIQNIQKEIYEQCSNDLYKIVKNKGFLDYYDKDGNLLYSTSNI